MLTSPALRLQWSWINHLELPTSWISKTISLNMYWHMWPLIKLQKLSLNFYMEAISLSLEPWPGSWVTEVLALPVASLRNCVRSLASNDYRLCPTTPRLMGLVEKSHQMIMHMIGKLGEDKKANWPSHLAEIVHTYNATQSAVTGYSPHYLMFGWWPRLPVDFIFPTIGSNEAPTREASTRRVDVYVASVRDQLRSALQEAQAQSTAEACQQKQYYNRKIGAMNLKPGDLVLLKADAWKGKRKIKDRWDEETWEVSQQIAADVPSYKVTNQHRWSWVLHWNQLLLIMSEVGIPLCMGNCHTWDRFTSPTPCKTTSSGGDGERTPQEKDGKVVTQWPTSKASLKWKNGKLWLGLWMSIGVSTEDRWRPQVKWFGCRPWKEHICEAEVWCLYPLMLADSEPKEECYHSLNWVMAGKAK